MLCVKICIIMENFDRTIYAGCTCLSKYLNSTEPHLFMYVVPSICWDGHKISLSIHLYTFSLIELISGSNRKAKYAFLV